MSDLQNQTPANTYKGLLQVNDYTNGVDATAKYIQDGEGTDSSLAISTSNIGIGTDSPDAPLHVDVVGQSNVLKLTRDDGVNGTLTANFVGADANFNCSDGGYKFAAANATDAFIVDGDGNVGIGTDSPATTLHCEDATNVSTLRLSTGSSSGYAQVKGGGTTGSFTIEADPTDAVAGSVIVFKSDGSERMRIDSSGTILPGTDNTQDLGSASKRWDVIYVKDTNITTSDREQKQDIEELTEAETRVAQTCKGLLRKYRWKDQVVAKGDEARIHFGIIAQDLEDAFNAEGLDAGRYGMFVKNTWWTADRVIPAVEAVEAVEAVYDEEGNELSPAVEAVEAQPERTVTDIFNNSEDAPEGATEVTQRGVRYSELLAFIISAI